MQTSRFQLGLIATLAVGLGFSLASSVAVGYPAGAVSMGSNPRWSVNGDVARDDSFADVLTVPVGQVAIVTGISHNVGSDLHVYRDDELVIDGRTNATTNALFKEGRGNLLIEGGATLRVMNTKPYSSSGLPNFFYFEGYYAQP